MISLAEAQVRLLALADALPPVIAPLTKASGHYLAKDIIAKRMQPAADLSAMDGYAIRVADIPGPWTLIGESAAGAPFAGGIGKHETARIFTGAHVPSGADTILVQEDTKAEGLVINLDGEGPGYAGKHIRKAGSDFAKNDILLIKGQILSPGAIAVSAMAGLGSVLVGGRAKVAIIATGNELVPPGTLHTAAQIPSSNSIMLATMLDDLPCDITDYGIVPDSLSALKQAFSDCADADVIVTTGGASVGDHDYVQAALIEAGADMDFWRIAMKPGKPVMAGKLGKSVVLGLPGNPSSAFVTAFLLLLPLVRHLSGAQSPYPPQEQGVLVSNLLPTQNRAEYLRGHLAAGLVSAFYGQDSGLVTTLAKANALIIRPPLAPEMKAGETVTLHRI
jgi:molybdopterin molybdotransferase